MKNLICVVSAMMLVFGFAATSMADCGACGDEGPRRINRGCEGSQAAVEPFDFDERMRVNENDYKFTDNTQYSFETADVADLPANFCTDKNSEKFFWEICQCEESGDLDVLYADDNLRIQKMEILVNGADTPTQNQGVYWYEDIREGVSGTTAMGTTFNGAIAGGSWDSQQQACSSNWNDWFVDNYDYLDYSGNAASPGGTATTIAVQDASSEDTTLGMNLGGTQSWLSMDIPSMYVVPSQVSKDATVQVRITVQKAGTAANVCASCVCCCTFDVGILCCESEMEAALIYPYLPSFDGWYGAQGISLTNLGSEAGTADVFIYEADGDVGEFTTETISANGTVNWNSADLLDAATLTTEGDGPTAGALGNDRCYIRIETTWPSTGLGYFANTDNGEAMGYIPIHMDVE